MTRYRSHTFVLLPAFLSLLILSGCSDDHTSTSKGTSAFSSHVKNELMPGASIVRRKCANCHFLDKKMRKVGPGLAGIYMSKPKGADLPFEVWDDKALDAWLKDPIGIKPKTAMAISGLRDPKDRVQVIEYLKTL